jgi:hypothetical protein
MFIYDFTDITETESRWANILTRTKPGENGCLLWNAMVRDTGIPNYASNSFRCNPVNFAFQYYNRKFKFNAKEHILIKTCENKLCLAKDHFKIKYKHILDFDEAHNRLINGSIRLEPKELPIGCLLWKNKPNPRGYGTTSLHGKDYRVHILAIFIKEKIRELPINEHGERLSVRHFTTKTVVKCLI